MKRYIGNLLTGAKKHWKRTILIIIVLAIIYGIYKKFTSVPAGVSTAQVQATTLVSTVTANGKVAARKAVDLKFNQPGRVAWVRVKNGDKVRAWQGVAGLDTIAINAAYQQALNNYRNYTAIAEKVLDDVKDHDSDESFSLRVTRTTAEVNRDNAYDAVTAARDSLDKAVLVSPIAGVVADTNDLVAGINLTGSDLEKKLIKIVDPASLYFVANLDEVDFGKVKVGQETIIEVDAFPGESCSGKVSFVGQSGQETSGGVVTIPVEINFSGCRSELAVGLNGQAEFVTNRQENVLVIPKKYLISKNGKDQAWLQTGDSVRSRKLVPVKVGTVTSTEVEILEGLKAGDTVIFTP